MCPYQPQTVKYLLAILCKNCVKAEKYLDVPKIIWDAHFCVFAHAHYSGKFYIQHVYLEISPTKFDRPHFQTQTGRSLTAC